MAIKRKVEKVLAEQYTIRGWVAIAGTDAFDAITNCEDFNSIVDRSAEGAARRDDIREGYMIAGVNLTSYDLGSYVPANKMFVCPIIDDFYMSFFAPMDSSLTNNKEGLPFYANSYVSQNQKTLTVESESNAIHLAVVPEAIVDTTVS